MSVEIINPDNHVYISYAWRDGVEQYVLDVCQVMNDNGIQYERDKDGLCPYKANIAEVEKIIGEGDAVIVFVSKKYMTSLHTMNEWHNILTKGDIARRVFIVVLEDAEISNFKSYKSFRNDLHTQYETIKTKYRECEDSLIRPADVLTTVELLAYQNLGFVYDLDQLYAFCRNFNRGSGIEVHRKQQFKEIIEPLKKYVTELADVANAKKTIREKDVIINDLQKQLGQRDAKIGELTLANEKLKKTLKAVWDKLKNQKTKSATASPSALAGYVDLGLSVLWATCNVGAKKSWESGGYYAWNEAKKKNLEMPTDDEFEDLLTKCQWSDWITDYEGHKGVNGYIVSGNGNSIFLPAAGWKESDGTLSGAGSYGDYLSSSLNSGDTDCEQGLLFHSVNRGVYWLDRYHGLSVRAVRHRN